ncbi:hypothetical protein H4V97_002915 [Flavobacterium sp. CG_23.5]|uniref:DUF6146 family protein n=1 Tax=Flavobacterium sp. CG_23.5 TaxID=2760708 RepID=UPI001AE54BF5|nr:DUF6146 family protein [Flavobacterium sp. CG_23.5]MBP2284597.1 hypothetical protein [Flavobacterium sp. CG_23.5]
MKNSIYILAVIFCILIGCTTSKSTVTDKNKLTGTKSDTVRIANDKLEYEVLIIDPGFSSWIITNTYPRGFYSQSYLEGKNRAWVSEYNIRVLQPMRYSPNLYEMTINYDTNIDYGYEVNYLIYNYMVYFQNTYKQKLFGYVPPR